MESLNKQLYLYQYVDIIKDALAHDKTARLDIIGPSMMPSLREGDYVVLDKPNDLKRGDIILYKVDDTTFNLHRIKKISEPLKVLGDNNIIVENVACDNVIAKVVNIYHNGKKVNGITNSYHRLYSVIRRFLRKVRRKLAR